MKFKHVTFALVAMMVFGLVLAGAPAIQAHGNAQGAVCAETYTVAAGDLLSTIAQKFLGDLKAYTQIVDATNAAAKVDTSFKAIADPNIIEVGQKLCIPAKSATAPTTAATTVPAQATTAAVGGAAAGLYTQTGPAADASHLVYLITLDANGGMVKTMSYLGKSNIVAKGTWKQSGDAVTLNFTEDNGKPSTDVVVMKAEGDKLTTTQDDNKQFGNVGFAATKTLANVALFSGVWNSTIKSADSNERLFALTLPPDGTALYYENVTDSNGVSKSGTWTVDGSKVTLKLKKQVDKDIDETLVFELQNNKLVATEYDKTVWTTGLTLDHVQNIGATTAAAPAPVATTPAVTPTPTPAPVVAPLTLAQLGSATYTVQDAPGGKVTLASGKAEVEQAPGSASKYTAQIAEPLANGAMNDKPYAAAVLITSGGGSGTFYNLAVVPNENGKPGTGLTALLGDRIKVASIAFQNNATVVNYLDRKPEEPFTAAPSVPVTKSFIINSAGALVEGQATAAATGSPVGGTGFAGTWLANSPAADASALLETLVLGQDGVATLSSNYVGKGVIVDTGTWSQTSDNTADVVFTKSDDRNINDALTFQINGDVITATKYEASKHGDNPPTYYRATGTVTGTVTYVQKIALPDNAVVEVYLVDASKQDVPYTYLSGASFTTNGNQVPLSYTIPYAGAQVPAGGRYFVVAFVSADGRLLFKNSNGVPVLTNGAASSNVEIVVQPPAE